jgi:hypothetical protein
MEGRTLFAAAAIEAPDVRAAGGDSVAVTVTYTDDKASTPAASAART